jgi:hypothetical protein
VELGLRRFVDDVRSKRHRFRQAMGGVFGAFLVVLARPAWWGFIVGVALVCGGALVRLWAAGHVRKNEVLETHGPYAFVRHPQYLGNCLIAVGWCAACGHPWAVCIWAVLFYLFYVPAIRREDDKLRRRFGEAWQTWRVRTPAVVPTHWPAPDHDTRPMGWSPMQAIRNGEPIWLTLMVIGLLLIYLRLT